jgi:hypothetical protein
MDFIGHKAITNVQGLIAYIGDNSAWSTVPSAMSSPL